MLVCYINRTCTIQRCSHICYMKVQKCTAPILCTVYTVDEIGKWYTACWHSFDVECVVFIKTNGMYFVEGFAFDARSFGIRAMRAVYFGWWARAVAHAVWYCRSLPCIRAKSCAYSISEFPCARGNGVAGLKSEFT